MKFSVIFRISNRCSIAADLYQEYQRYLYLMIESLFSEAFFPRFGRLLCLIKYPYYPCPL